uniref:MAGE domain-containing protein n=1 Tax=Propithecus coquereli TaxID=379532 RepID=A0A2K6EWE9_PROCO
MPRGQKSKLQAREKRHQARCKSHDTGGAQATAAAAAAKESPPEESPPEESPPSPSLSEGPQETPSTTTTSEVISCTRSDEDSNVQDETKESNAEASPCSEKSCNDPLASNIKVLEQFLLFKYKTKQPILKADMLKVVSWRYKDHFPEIFKKACEHIELVFAVDVQEIDSTRQLYDLVSKLKLPNKGRVRAGRGLPKGGLLMNILGMIFMKDNCATEEDVWRYLSMMRIYAGRKHFVYGEPKKLITKDFVRLKYLEYRQVPDSDPACYEFLWGPRAHAETSKMEVLKFLAKINETEPSAFPSQYEEALRDEETRAQAQTVGVAKRGATAKACALCKAMRS